MPYGNKELQSNQKGIKIVLSQHIPPQREKKKFYKSKERR